MVYATETNMEQHTLSDQIIIGIVSGVIVVVLLGIWKVIHDQKDTDKIITFLNNSEATTDNTFRSNHAISSDTNLSEDRVRKLCSKSRKIKRNTKEKESWRLV